MANRLPQLTLALLLAVAACVILGGASLARRTETVRSWRDRAPLRDFAGTLEQETRRLERLYETHLRAIADAVDLRNPGQIRGRCEGIVGIRQLSVLHGAADREPDQHVVAIKPPTGEPWPEPALREQRNGLPRPTIRLLERELLGKDAERAGWIDRPGQPLLFWQRRSSDDVAVVFMVDRAQVSAAIDEWIRLWVTSGASGTFEGLSAAGGPDRILGASGLVLGAAGPTPSLPEQPDFLLPLRARFGTWHLASWDHYDIRTSYHGPTLAGASVLGVFTMLLGMGVFLQQRRAFALAAQRVSFVNRVSHELRTPLTNILLNIDLASEAVKHAPRESTRRLTLVQEETRRLGRLIDNVLTFSRHEQGKLRRDPKQCVPASVVAAVVDQFAPSFGRRDLEIVCTGQVSVPCILDADGLAQILANLLSNVEKYVLAGSVEIRSKYHEGELVITVSDTGPGIAASEAERIFRPFERLGSRVNEGATGTGLGLAIARDLALSMGGSLRLIPAARGASFQLCIPAPRMPHQELFLERQAPTMTG